MKALLKQLSDMTLAPALLIVLFGVGFAIFNGFRYAKAPRASAVVDSVKFERGMYKPVYRVGEKLYESSSASSWLAYRQGESFQIVLSERQKTAMVASWASFAIGPCIFLGIGAMGTAGSLLLRKASSGIA